MPASIRNLPTPSGADVEAFVNQRLSEILAQSPAGSGSFKAKDYDIQVSKANHFPGEHWEYVGLAGVGHDVYVIWRMSRIKQAELGLTPIMKTPEKPANSIG